MCLFSVSNRTGARMEVPIQLLCKDGIIDGKYLTMYTLSPFSWKRVCMCWSPLCPEDLMLGHVFFPVHWKER